MMDRQDGERTHQDRDAVHDSEAGADGGVGAPAGSAEADRRAAHRHRLLLVEDDYDVRTAMQAVLELEGFRLLTAEDGSQALDRLHQEPPPCLILLDLTMPVSDGRDFRRRQLQEPDLAAIPTVLFSAHEGIAQRARELGIAEYLSKPADVDALADVIARRCRCAA
jgi:CheY-like chemotaxis protein